MHAIEHVEVWSYFRYCCFRTLQARSGTSTEKTLRLTTQFLRLRHEHFGRGCAQCDCKWVKQESDRQIIRSAPRLRDTDLSAPTQEPEAICMRLIARI